MSYKDQSERNLLHGGELFEHFSKAEVFRQSLNILSSIHWLHGTWSSMATAERSWTDWEHGKPGLGEPFSCRSDDQRKL